MPIGNWFVSTTLGMVILLMSGGCVSLNRNVYRSHPDRPSTVTVYNSVTQEPFWSYDVPPNYKLILDYDIGDSGNVCTPFGARRPSKLTWSLYPDDAPGWLDKFPFGWPKESDTVYFPGVSVREKVTFGHSKSGRFGGQPMPPLDIEISSNPASIDLEPMVDQP